MRRLASLVVVVLSASTAAAGTRVTLTGTTEGAEVCRFAAGDREKPAERWLRAQAVTCAAPDAALTFPPGLWNVFARAKGMLSVDPILVDGAAAPADLAVSLAPAASVVLQLPPGASGVWYAPKHAVAYPAAERTVLPAGEELWLILSVKGVPDRVLPIAALEPGIERVVDARDVSDAPAVLGWVHVSEADRAAVKTARGVELPHVGIRTAGKEIVAASLPAPDALNGAFVLFRGAAAGEAELRLDGRGWLPFRRSLRIDPRGVTLLGEPIPARPSATVIVNWSTYGDLAALERSLGSCEPPKEAPRLELTISACPEPKPGKALDPASCSPIRTEPLRLELKFGSVRVDEVPPGMYRAELRFGRLPPIDVEAEVPPLQQRPMPPLQAMYFEVYGTLTRGGALLGDDARIEFPHRGVGFAVRGTGAYRGVLEEGFAEDARIDVVTCGGRHAFVLADRGVGRFGNPQRVPATRFDIDIPDNALTVSVVDTFTQMPLPAAKLQYVVMSLSVPRRPVVTLDLPQSEAAGQFAIQGVPPEHELRLTVSCPGYKKKEIDPFSMTKRETKAIDVALVPLGGAEAKILSARPFASGTIYWFSSEGVETERADLAADGTFRFERTHYRDETMTVVSLSHPLWILRAPPVERATPLQVRFPDAVPQRDVEVAIDHMPARLVTLLGVAIGGLRVPQPALAQHLALRGGAPLVRGAGPALIPALAESGPIDILRGPSVLQQQQRQPIEMFVTRNFDPSATRRLEPGSARVEFGPVSK